MSALRRKPLVVLLSLVLAFALFGAAATPWVQAVVATTVSEVQVQVRGTQAAPAVSALALVAAAGSVALSIAGPRVRGVVAAIIALSGLGAAAAIVGVLADPVGVSEGAVGEATGVIGSGAEHTLTVWPPIALALAVLVSAAGIWALIVSRGWARPGASRYDRGTDQRRAAAEAPGDAREDGRRDDIDTWDALTEGRDPTRG